MDKEYLCEDRYVDFIDILEFKNLLQKDKANSIKSVLKVLCKEKQKTTTKTKAINLCLV